MRHLGKGKSKTVRGKKKKTCVLSVTDGQSQHPLTCAFFFSIPFQIHMMRHAWNDKFFIFYLFFFPVAVWSWLVDWLETCLCCHSDTDVVVSSYR